MKYFAVVAFLTATAVNVNALVVEDDCCEVPTGTSCPSDYPVALTTTAEVREALSLSGVACCASDAQASEFGKDPLVACPAVVETTSDGDEDATVTTTAAGGPLTLLILAVLQQIRHAQTTRCYWKMLILMLKVPRFMHAAYQMETLI